MKHISLDFPLLHDAGNRVTAGFGLKFVFPPDLKELYERDFGLNLLEMNGRSSGWSLPIPASYIIDRDCIIRYARLNADYTRRPEPSETLEALKAIVN